jgi:hypothetical protein
LVASAAGGDSVLLSVLGASVVVLSLFPKDSVVVIPAANAKSSIGLFSSAGDEDSVLLLVLGGSVVVLLLGLVPLALSVFEEMLRHIV